jgi:hypothetical protein
MVQELMVPLPPLLDIVTVIAVPLNVAILPSIKFVGDAVLSTLTRCPTVNAVAVDDKFVVNVNVPLDAIVWLLADVNPL